MELLKSVRRRSNLSEVLYIGFNIAFALAVLLLTIAFSSPWVAYALVLLSKWRVFAVRPRFWFANIQTNLLDVLVGLSVVTLIWQSTGAIFSQIFIAVLFALWLLVLKPRSKRRLVVLQAGIAQFVALTALFSQAYQVYAFVVVILTWLIGYIVARHVLTTFEDDNVTVLSMAWGLIVAEISWLAYHSTTGYGVLGVMMVPQVALVVSLIGFGVYSFYSHHHEASSGKSNIKFNRRLGFVAVALVLLIGREIAVLL